MAKYWSIQGKYPYSAQTKIQNCTKTINEIYCTLMSFQKHPLTASYGIQRNYSPQINQWERFDYSFGRVLKWLYMLFPSLFYIFSYITTEAKDGDVNYLLSASNVLLCDRSRAVWICLHRWSEQYRHCSGTQPSHIHYDKWTAN